MKTRIYIRLLAIVLLFIVGIGLYLIGLADIGLLFLTASIGAYFISFGVFLYYPNELFINNSVLNFFFIRKYLPAIFMVFYTIFYLKTKNDVPSGNASAYFTCIIVVGFGLHALLFVKDMKRLPSK